MDLMSLDAVVLSTGLVVTLLTVGVGYRVIRGPTVPDRVVALDVISTHFVALVALFSLYTRSGFYINAAVVIAVIGFVSTVASAKYLIDDRMLSD
ncbi:MAG: monovalent cation/H+ antiporter complex subunit F [Halobacteria archaeon]|nr:monovalent cation/H+ antiporter complex subunit F [Halobacteria archaeon]